MTGRTSGRAPRVLVVYKKSSYDIYVRERRNTRVQELLEAGDASVANLRRAHEHHRDALLQARTCLQKLGARATFRYRSSRTAVDEFDLVVTLGGDGTLLWASHWTGSQCPIIAINTAPKDSVGHFCAGTSQQLEDMLADALAGRLPVVRLSRMSVLVDNELVSSRVLNDILFAHTCPAATTRFELEHAGERRVFKCSGIWVGPAAGSTAALRSAGGRVMAIGSKRLQYVVREPYFTAGADRSLSKGFVEPSDTLKVTSHIRQGRLYVDGPHQGCVIDIGSHVALKLSHEPLSLLGYRGRDDREVEPGSNEQVA